MRVLEDQVVELRRGAERPIPGDLLAPGNLGFRTDSPHLYDGWVAVGLGPRRSSKGFTHTRVYIYIYIYIVYIYIYNIHIYMIYIAAPKDAANSHG